MIVKGDYTELLNRSKELIPNPDANRKMKFGVQQVGQHGYATVTNLEWVSGLNYTEVDEIPTPCSSCGVGYSEDQLNDERVCEFCVAYLGQPIERKARQARIDFLITQSSGTAIEAYVMELLQRYAIEVVEFVETGSTSLADAINAEAEQPFLTYLAIELPYRGGTLTVKDNIINRITL